MNNQTYLANPLTSKGSNVPPFDRSLTAKLDARQTSCAQGGYLLIRIRKRKRLGVWLLNYSSYKPVRVKKACGAHYLPLHSEAPGTALGIK